MKINKARKKFATIERQLLTRSLSQPKAMKELRRLNKVYGIVSGEYLRTK